MGTYRLLNENPPRNLDGILEETSLSFYLWLFNVSWVIFFLAKWAAKAFSFDDQRERKKRLTWGSEKKYSRETSGESAVIHIVPARISQAILDPRPKIGHLRDYSLQRVKRRPLSNPGLVFGGKRISNEEGVIDRSIFSGHLRAKIPAHWPLAMSLSPVQLPFP